MNTIQYGIRSYRNHLPDKTTPSSHPLDILSSILFDLRQENLRREKDTSPGEEKSSPETFQEILKRELKK